MNSTVYIGSDLDKKRAFMHVVDQNGDFLWEGYVPRTRDSLAKFLERYGGKEVKVAMEACNGVWPTVDYLQGTEVRVVAPSKNRLIGQSTKKSDKEDARKLCNLLRSGYLPEVYVPTKEERQFRELSRERENLVMTRVRFMQQVAMLEIRDGERNEYVMRRERLREIMSQEIKAATADVKDAIKGSREAKLLMKISGIGPISSAEILGEICDIRRFASSKKLSAFCGLVPTLRESGSTTHHGKCRKDSNRRLRRILVQCAWVSIRFDPKMQEFYARKVPQIGKKKAIVAVARKLACRIFWTLHNDAHALTSTLHPWGNFPKI